jgi:hypothetical protein
MKLIDEILLIEDQNWRAKPYRELEKLLENVSCYSIEHKNALFQFEVHSKRSSKNRDEIIIRVECSRNSLVGSFFGKARYFAKSLHMGIREIDNDEAF